MARFVRKANNITNTRMIIKYYKKTSIQYHYFISFGQNNINYMKVQNITFLK